MAQTSLGSLRTVLLVLLSGGLDGLEPLSDCFKVNLILTYILSQGTISHVQSLVAKNNVH
jgi:hypothetical protein